MGIKKLVTDFAYPIFLSAGSAFFGVNLLFISLILLALKRCLKNKFILHFNSLLYIGICFAILQILISSVCCVRYTREARKIMTTLAKEPELEAGMVVITEGAIKAAGKNGSITDARTKYVAQELGKNDG